MPASTSPIARASIHLQDILSFIVLIADLLFGYYQVRHVDAAVGQPASSHKCEQDPRVWEYESRSSEVEKAVICSISTSTVSTHTTAEAAAAQDTVTARSQLNQAGVQLIVLVTHTTAGTNYRYKLASKYGIVIGESKNENTNCPS